MMVFMVSGIAGIRSFNSVLVTPYSVLPLLQRAANAILSHPPEMQCQQRRGRQRQADAMQHVEPIQRLLAERTAAKEQEPGIACRLAPTVTAHRDNWSHGKR